MTVGLIIGRNNITLFDVTKIVPNEDDETILFYSNNKTVSEVLKADIQSWVVTEDNL